MTGRDLILVSTLWFSRSRNRLTSSDLTMGDQKTRCGGQYGGNLVFYFLYLEFYEIWRPNADGNFMVFEVNKCNDVIRFNIGRSENKMAANMAEI